MCEGKVRKKGAKIQKKKKGMKKKYLKQKLQSSIQRELRETFLSIFKLKNRER